MASSQSIIHKACFFLLLWTVVQGYRNGLKIGKTGEATCVEFGASDRNSNWFRWEKECKCEYGFVLNCDTNSTHIGRRKFPASLDPSKCKCQLLRAPEVVHTPVASFGAEARSMWNAYVEETRAKYSDAGKTIQSGCEPKLYEHQGETYRGTIIYFHGFTACPQQVHDLIPALTAKGYVVLTPINPGHGASFKRSGEEVEDFIDLMPTDLRELERHAERMNAIMAKAGGETVAFGLSLGGAIASYAGTATDFQYTRRLISVPMINVAGNLEYIARIADKILGLRKMRFSWGPGCEKERSGGRAGVCQFNADIVAAASSFGSKHLSSLEYEDGSLYLQRGGIQMIFVEQDAAVTVTDIQELAKKLGVGKHSPYICGLDKEAGHSFLSPYDNPDQNKYWLKEIGQRVVDYLAEGTLLPQDGVIESEDSYPRCQLTCTAESCPWSRPGGRSTLDLSASRSELEAEIKAIAAGEEM